MSEFIDAARTFPAALFSFSLVVIVGYWIAVLLGGLDIELLDSDSGTDGNGDNPAGIGGLLGAIGLGGVPVTIVISLLIAISWFISFVGTVLLDQMDLAAPIDFLFSVGVLVAAIVIAAFATRVVISPLRRLFVEIPPPSRSDFVGRVCIIRTGRIGPNFGQAEVRASDGSSAVIQVRHDGRADNDALMRGSKALIYDYQTEGGFFLVTPTDATFDLDQQQPT